MWGEEEEERRRRRKRVGGWVGGQVFLVFQKAASKGELPIGHQGH